MENALYIIIPLLCIMLVSSLVILISMLRRRKSVLQPAIWFLIVSCIWLVSHIFEILLSDGTILFIKRIQLSALSFLPGLLFLFVLDYTNYLKKNKKITALIISVPVVLAICALFTGLSDSTWGTMSIRHVNSTLSLVNLNYGPAYAVYLIYTGVMLIISCTIAASSIRRANKCFGSDLLRLACLPVIPPMTFILGIVLDPVHSLEFAQYGMFIAAVMIAILQNSKYRAYMPLLRAEAIDAIPVAYIFTDNKGIILDVNPHAEMLLGKAADIVGKPLPDMMEAWLGYEPELVISNGQVESLVYELKVSIGNYYEYYSIETYGIEGSGTIITIKNITEQKLEQERNEYSSTMDMVTGLPNRSLFAKMLQHELNNQRRYNYEIALLSIKIIDISKLKAGHGMAFGDKIMRETAKKLERLFRKVDTIARLEDDSFCVILPRIKNYKEDIPVILNRLFRDFENPVMLGNEEYKVELRVGIAIAPNDGNTVDELVSNADLASYYANQHGVREYFYSSEE